MKKNIGVIISKIGAYLWENGGFWNERHRYEDLTIFGKLGYNMFRAGIKMMGLTRNDVIRMMPNR